MVHIPETECDFAKKVPDVNKLARFLIKNALGGMLAGWVMVGTAVAMDVAGLQTLVFDSSVGLLGLILLMFFVGLTCASLAMGSAIMGLGRESDGDDGRPRGLRPVSLTALLSRHQRRRVPVPARARARR